MMRAALALLLFLPAVFCIVKSKKDAAICTDKNTICMTSKYGYGCCPSEDAVCCADGEHCCAKGFECNIAAGKCLQYGDPAFYVLTEEMMIIAPMTAARSRAFRSLLRHAPKLSTIEVAVEAEIVCPDGMSKCLDNETCCKHSSDSYACCPRKDAVCCSDMKHCCPEGYQCELSTNTCIKKTSTITAIPLQELLTRVICPDGKSTCADGQTCCLSLNGTYSCCPEPNGVCCSDHIHCCPEGNTCDVGSETCLKNVVCPDGTSQCPYGNTCCKTNLGVYGCCPILDATCCDDGVHCCHSGYICKEGMCTNPTNGKKMPFLSKFSATKLLQDQHGGVSQKDPTSASVICPGGKSVCPSGETCCPTAKQDVFGCCPVHEAVCCDDHIHCCPKGFTCDIQNGTCYESITGKKTPLLTRQPTVDLEPKDSEKPMTALTVPKLTLPNIICPDEKSQCPNGNTCCELAGGVYGCCPVPKAVCCSDGVHCCPSGYSCDVKQGTCTDGAADVKIPLLTKQPAIALIPKDSEKPMTALTVPKLTLPNIICPDEKSQCPNGNTCCELAGGVYGCCPVPKAVCCSDGVHCCPSGYSCDVKQGTCTDGLTGLTAAMLTKQPAVVQPMESVICPDHDTECPADQTCCQTLTGAYGCCPLNNATCCPDKKHCCPYSYKCEKETGICTKGIDKLITQKLSVMTKPLQAVNCSDGTHCPDNQTCCLLRSEKYGCCPRKDAVCCSDKVHCCPEGYSCLNNKGTCVKGTISVAAHKVTTIVNVMCPDHRSECPSGNTCCREPDGHFRCCTYPKAACCSDGIHCCPEGYKCNMTAHSCDQQWSKIPFLSKSPHVRIL
ncbi:progranulin-like [Dysidea avara]|uniref:progranulin-like n=1 Tax=Dysidea avara TaxID=196820 RepID=UPI00332558F1